ncbi:hypothetical protein JCM8097_007056 [Rhodosporidiobolus ruineniae]
MAAVFSRPAFDREQTDELLRLLDPAHYSARRTGDPPPRRRLAAPPPRSRTPSIASVHSLAQLLAPSPRPLSRPASILSRSSRRSTRASFLSLPIELVEHIVRLALPAAHTRHSTLEHGRTLATLALVHPALRVFAQGELFGRTVVLASEASVEKLLGLALDPNKAHLVRQITSVKVYGSLATGDGGKTLARLVHQLKALETLHLEELDGLELRQFVVHPTLKALTATRCGFRSRFRDVGSAKPSHLTSLSLTSCTAHDDAFAGFTLPSLTHLRLFDVYLPPFSPLSELEPSDAFKALGAKVAAQLHELETDEAHFGLFFPLPRYVGREGPVRCKLRTLRLVKLQHLERVLDALPSSSSSVVGGLETLHFSPPTSFLSTHTSADRATAHFSSLLSPFRASSPAAPPSLRNVKTLLLDARYAAWLEAGDEDAKELVERAERAGLAGGEKRHARRGGQSVGAEGAGGSAASGAERREVGVGGLELVTASLVGTLSCGLYD